MAIWVEIVTAVSPKTYFSILFLNLILLKMLNITLNEGYDPMDGIYKAGPVKVPHCREFKTYDDLYNKLNTNLLWAIN